MASAHGVEHMMRSATKPARAATGELQGSSIATL